MTGTQDSWQQHFSIETSATAEAIWNLFRDRPRMEELECRDRVDRVGRSVRDRLTVVHDEASRPGCISLPALDVRGNECFVDETRIGDLVVKVEHRIQSLGALRTQVIYALTATGPGAAELAPAIASDFPEVLAQLAAPCRGKPKGSLSRLLQEASAA